MKKVGLTLASVLLAASLAGCSSSSDNNSSESGNDTGAGSEQSSVSYFDECDVLATPDSVLDVTQSSRSTTSTNGATTEYKYHYSFNNASSDISSDFDSYLDRLSADGLSTAQEDESECSIMSSDNEILASIELDESGKTITLTIYAEGNRKTVNNISIGQTIETEDYTFTLTNLEWVDEIYPPDTSGYYTYYQDEEGKKYCLITGTFKNTGGDLFDMGATKVAFKDMSGKYNFTGSAEYAYDGGVGSNGLDWIDNFYGIDPLTEVPLYIFASISDEVASNCTAGTLEWTFEDGNIYRLSIV